MACYNEHLHTNMCNQITNMFMWKVLLIVNVYFPLIHSSDVTKPSFKLEGYTAYTQLTEGLSNTVKTRSYEAVTYILKLSPNLSDITGLLSYTTPDVLLFFEFIYSVVKQDSPLSNLLLEAAEKFEKDRKRKNLNKRTLNTHKRWLENNFNFHPTEIYNFTKIITQGTIKDVKDIPQIISDQIHLLEQKYKIIEQAFDNGDVNIINWFLKTGYPVNNLSLEFFENSFNKGHLNIVEFLLRYNFLQKVKITSEMVNKKYFQDQTLLHVACYGSAAEALDFLISKGAKVDAIDSLGRTPLYRAVEAGNVTIIKELARREANISIVYGGSGESLLHVAASLNKVDCIKALVDLGLSANTVNKVGDTPLHSAVKYEENIDVVLQLFMLGANPNVKNNEEETPFIIAVRKKNIKIIREIVRKNPAYLTDKTANGDNPLHIAADLGDIDLVDTLLKMNLDPNLKNYKNHMPLYTAAIRGNQDVVDLLAPKTDLTSVNNGLTMLHEAVLEGNIKAVRILLKLSIDVDIKGLWKNTPLHLAARLGFVNLVDIFLANGARSNASNKDHMTPLHYAALGGHYGVVERLINACSSLSIKNKLGKTPVDLAKANNHDISRFVTPRFCPTV